MPRRREGKEINGRVRLLKVGGGLSHRGGGGGLGLVLVEETSSCQEEAVF